VLRYNGCRCERVSHQRASPGEGRWQRVQSAMSAR
jgi:hypothetical protein